jgi:cell division protease FtsH
VRRIIVEQYTIARKLIEENADKMHAMAKALMEWETIDADQIKDIMEGREPTVSKDFVPRIVKNNHPDKPSGGSGAVPVNEDSVAAVPIITNPEQAQTAQSQGG